MAETVEMGQCLLCDQEDPAIEMVIWVDADGEGHWLHPWCHPG